MLVDDNLIEEITRIVCGLLERHVRESVTAAVRALAPRMVVSLPGRELTVATDEPDGRPDPARKRFGE